VFLSRVEVDSGESIPFMRKKQILIYASVFAVLTVLMYMQFRTWRNFDWHTFWQQTDRVSLLSIAYGITMIYAAFAIRALRWAIFLKPVRRTSSTRLFVPTILGFTGVALLGRAGELIRPYLIARRENLPVSSQIAVWAVERIFDVAAYTIILVLAIFLAPDLRLFPYYGAVRRGGFLLIGLVAGSALAVSILRWKGEDLASWVERRLAHIGSNFGHKIGLLIREFREGLNTIHGPVELAQLTGVSVLMWSLIAGTFWEVTHAYGVAVLNIPISQLLLLVGSSMVGSVVQLPGVGGGSQLAMISVLAHFFNVPKELAASCGIMLWLVSFVSVVPLGLALAHRERLSLRKLSAESQKET
jgi:glycosyltransferase 2 family protein